MLLTSKIPPTKQPHEAQSGSKGSHAWPMGCSNYHDRQILLIFFCEQELVGQTLEDLLFGFFYGLNKRELLLQNLEAVKVSPNSVMAFLNSPLQYCESISQHCRSIPQHCKSTPQYCIGSPQYCIASPQYSKVALSIGKVPLNIVKIPLI